MKRHFFLAAVGLFLQWHVVCGQLDSLQIKGPKEVSPGQLVRLDATLQPDESPFWIVLSPTDLDYEQVADGKRLIFAVDCNQRRSITILLLAQQVRDGRIITRQIRRTLAVTQTGNDQVDTPENPDWKQSPLFSSVATAWESINQESAKSKTDLVAVNFDLVATLCESGKIKRVEEIWKRLSESNQKVLAELTPQWETVGIAMQSGFRSLQLTSVSEHTFHLRAIAAALRSKIQ